jgi:hypothetical protein
VISLGGIGVEGSKEVVNKMWRRNPALLFFLLCPKSAPAVANPFQIPLEFSGT